MATNLVSFYTENTLALKGENFVNRLEKDYPRPFVSLNKVLSPEYLYDLKEKGLFQDDFVNILNMFTLFRTVSIQQAAQFLLPQYTEEAHVFVAKLFARLYYLHFLHVIDIEDKQKKNLALYPLPSMSFILGPAGARYISSVKNQSLAEIGWKKDSILTEQKYGMHNIIVTEIIIRLTNLIRLLLMIPGIGVELDGVGEWDGRIFPKGTTGGKKVLARPDYTFRVRYQEGDTAISRSYFMEYDNGTESNDILLKKLADYQLAYSAGHFHLGSPASTSLLFVFNDSKRATRFYWSAVNRLKKELLPSLKRIYITTLDSIYQSGFFCRDWLSIDTNADDIKKHKDDVAEDSRKIVRESPFPEITEKLEKHDLISVFSGMYKDISGYDEDHFLQMELESFIMIRELMFPPAK